jgi:multicomponent Na+:H+ antiporter subunit E
VGPQQVVSGAVVSGLLTLFWAGRMSGRPGARDAAGIELPILALQPRFLLYLGRMAVEIVKANWAVAMIVLDPKMPISPHFVIVRTKLVHDLARVIYANSITLTPGTISVSLERDTLIVHAITREAAEGVAGWEIEDRIRELERPWVN